MVSAPATSANLGPGFDSFGLALALRDTVRGAVVAEGLHIEVKGEGAASVPRDESHLVVRAVRAAFDELGAVQQGLHLWCSNVIPHGRGLGSSAAAIVCGIRLGEQLAGRGRLSERAALALATRLEGHPDNAAAALCGGFTIAWREPNGPHVLRLDVHPEIEAIVFLPDAVLSTQTARQLLPPQVLHTDAGFNAARAGLLVVALTRRPELLWAATDDRLHQRFRRPAMPASLDLVDALRADGVAAVVSGAGPSVLALCTADMAFDAEHRRPDGWRVLRVQVEDAGAQ